MIQKILIHWKVLAMLLRAVPCLPCFRVISPGCRCLGQPSDSGLPVIPSRRMLSWLGWAVLSCLNVSNSYMEQLGLFPPLTFPLSHLGPGQVVVEVIQLIGLLLQGSLCPEQGPVPGRLPEGLPLLHQSEELGEGLMIAVPQHVHTDVLRVRVLVTAKRTGTLKALF